VGHQGVKEALGETVVLRGVWRCRRMQDPLLVEPQIEACVEELATTVGAQGEQLMSLRHAEDDVTQPVSGVTLQPEQGGPVVARGHIGDSKHVVCTTDGGNIHGEEVGGDDLTRALCTLFGGRGHFLMRHGDLFSECADVTREREMATAETCLLSIRVEV